MKWRFVIGSTFDPDSIRCCSYEVDAPDKDTATLIGKGHAFNAGWVVEGSTSYVEKLTEAELKL